MTSPVYADLLVPDALAVSPVRVEKTTGKRTMRVYDEYPIAQRNVFAENWHRRDTTALQTAFVSVMQNAGNQVRSALGTTLSAGKERSAPAAPIHEGILSVRTAYSKYGNQDPTIAQSLTSEAHAILEEFNRHLNELSEMAAESLVVISKGYESRTELAAVAFETDYTRLQDLLRDLQQRFDTVCCMKSMDGLDPFTRFIDRFRSGDAVPSALEKRMLVLARAVSVRLVLARNRLAQDIHALEAASDKAGAAIDAHIRLTCRECSRPFSDTRQALVLAPCGHNICTSCFEDLSGLHYDTECLKLDFSEIRCRFCKVRSEYVTLDKVVNERSSDVLAPASDALKQQCAVCRGLLASVDDAFLRAASSLLPYSEASDLHIS